VLLASAAMSFESGLLVWPVAVAAYASGLRGISGRGIVLMTVVVVLYAVFASVISAKQAPASANGARGLAPAR
jgi:hypothetical protein